MGGPAGKIGNVKTNVWRLTRSLRLNGRAELPPAPEVSTPDNAGSEFFPDIIVVEDDAAGFRLQFPHRCWHPSRGREPGAPSPLRILKTTAPLCQGDPWWTLANPQCPVDRLMAVLSVDDLRRENVQISRGISWERTAVDLVRELKESPTLSGLRQAQYVIVVLHGEGDLWMRRTGSEKWDFQLMFDTLHMEAEWSAGAGIEGAAYGFMSCFTAAVAVRIAFATKAESNPDIGTAITHGLRIMRLLRVLGHGEVGSAMPGFPFKQMALALIADRLGQEVEKAGNGMGEKLALAGSKIWPFGKTSVPMDVLGREHGSNRWHILEGESLALTANTGDDCSQQAKSEPL